MKTKLVASVLLALALTACNNNSDSNSGGKGDEGLGGGVIEVQQVQLLVDDIIAKVSAMPEVFPEVNIDQLTATTKKVEIIGREKTFANGTETDATNNGSTRIEINMKRWGKLKNQNKKGALIFHELLGIMGLEKNNYAISSRLLVEHRFGPERTYTCRQGTDPASPTCKIVMSYDHAQESFQVEDQNCGNFPTRTIVNYHPFNSYFSSTNYCPENLMEVAPANPPQSGTPETAEPEQQQLCSVQSGTGREWDSLYFKNGYAFRFLGVEGSQLNCSL